MGVFKNESEEMKKQISKLDDGLKALQKFDNEILDYEHLEDVDEMWGMITSVEEKLPDFSTKLENLEVNIATNTSSIENLESKVAILYEYEHLSDIDTIWSDVEFQKEKLSDLENAVNTHNQNIKDLELDTLLLKNFKDEVEKQEHIKQIDEIWRDVDAGKKSINSISEKVSYNEDTIQTVSISLDNEKKASQKLEDRVLKMESSTNLHKEKLEKIEQQEHLFDIDGLWNKEENSNSQINQLMGRLDVVTNSVEDLNNQLNVEKNVHESDVQLLHKKLKTAYYVGGGAVIFCVIEITLQLMRIL